VVRLAGLPGDPALRTRNIEGETIIVEGVRDGHDPAKMAAAMRGASNAGDAGDASTAGNG
jgi:thiazole synthase ThiGH ThiG subunit